MTHHEESEKRVDPAVLPQDHVPHATHAPHSAAHAAGPAPSRNPKPPQRAAVALDRDAVLRVTARVLDEKGFEKTTIRAIAARLGCAVGSIYRHFTDKHQLLEEVVAARFARIAEAAEAGAPCEATTRAFLAVAAGRPEQFRLMFWLAALSRGPQESTSVPSVMQRLVAAWSGPDQLGSLEASQAHWARHQGELMLGLHDGRRGDESAALAALDAIAEPAEPAEAAAASGALPPVAGLVASGEGAQNAAAPTA